MSEKARVKARFRVYGLIVYSVVLILIQYNIVRTGLTPNVNSIWLLSGFASLLFGSRLLNPHFTPPADAATNSFVAFAGVLAGATAVPVDTAEVLLVYLAAIFCAMILFVSIIVLLVRAPLGIEPRPWVRIADRAVRGLGSPSVIFTIVLLLSIWLFHRNQPLEVFAIVAAWAIIVAIRPVEAILEYFEWSFGEPDILTKENVIGEIVAHQSPGIVLVRQVGEAKVDRGAPLLVTDQNGPWMLGVALNYVGRDEGNLLRVLTTRLPDTLKGRVNKIGISKGAGLAMRLKVTPAELEEIKVFKWINRLCGVVASDTSLDHLLFEVTDETGLSEGRLVEVRIGDNQVIYQVLDGLTREDVVLQKNTYGYARAKARKVGKWDDDAKKFIPVKWLPRINAPVFLLDEVEHVGDATTIGNFPNTNYGVGINVSQAVTHNTAILGILGVGKSYLAIELVERMIAGGIKVICLDLTNQYADLLSEFIDPDFEEALSLELVTAGQGGVAHRNQEQGGSHRAFRDRVLTQMRTFVSQDERRYLRVLNPAQFVVTRQASGAYEGTANMATLTPTEITAIISDVALEVCQELGMVDEGRVCLVYEEAHSLVPEWSSVVAEGDKAATARSARAILQGRKYGLGCLLITQRTANVTKTILNQCNTIFAMKTFDDTGKGFLSNYIGGDYAGVLSSLEAQHAVVFGKASTCESPVLIKINNRQDFVDAFRPLHPVPQLPREEPDVVAPLIATLDLDDDVPF